MFSFPYWHRLPLLLPFISRNSHSQTLLTHSLVDKIACMFPNTDIMAASAASSIITVRYLIEHVVITNNQWRSTQYTKLQTKPYILLTCRTNLRALNVFFTCLQFSNMFRHALCVIFTEIYNIKIINFVFLFNYSPMFFDSHANITKN